MDFRKWIWLNVALVIVCLVVSGISQPVWSNAVDADDFEDASHDIDTRVPEFTSSESDVTNDDGSALLELLKRGGMYLGLPDSYRRASRLKSRVIIPFYSYGSDNGYYRSKPRLQSWQKPKMSYGRSPWNTNSGGFRNRFRSRGYSVY